jgi:GT2 family glycosyltransferase
MEAERWRTEQVKLREAMRARRNAAVARDAVPPDTATCPPASIIVVCWNSADVLGGCLRQLQAQEYPDYEIIVVDDGSRDETLRVAELAAAHGGLKIVRSPRNRGCPHARNLGLSHARGEIVAFIDADGFAAPSWLGHVVAAFGTDESIGGVASTVFFADNPLVLNGAGGIVNRQGWAADLSMNESYERAQIASEALYPMGCGMAVRRSALEAVGPFDDRMLNYYDDVDYGVRLWRAGYRVIVAPDAWIDHGFGSAGGDSDRKRLLCERHRMRVVLKHTPFGELARWAAYEARALGDASASRRLVKLRAMAWNTAHLPSALVSRVRLHRQPGVPGRLVDPSWGDAFPVGVPARRTPHPETAANVLDMAEPGSENQLLYGWFPAERAEDGRCCRWAGTDAAALIELRAPARVLRLDYTHVPTDMGGVDLYIRRVGSSEPLKPVWSAHLPWQYTERTVENHLLRLPAGDYEVLLHAREGWSDPPSETRLLSLALARMSFEGSYTVPDDRLDMSWPSIEDQLLNGWFEAERSLDRSYRWASGHAAAIVRLTGDARRARLSYRFPPDRSGDVRITARPVDSSEVAWSARLPWREGEWHEETLPLRLGPGDYEIAFDAEATWSNPGWRDRDLPPENRALGFGLSSLSLGVV